MYTKRKHGELTTGISTACLKAKANVEFVSEVVISVVDVR